MILSTIKGRIAEVYSNNGNSEFPRMVASSREDGAQANSRWYQLAYISHVVVSVEAP
jgi:hypothetical protein